MKRAEKLLLFTLIFIFAIGFSLVSILRHNRFESFGYDLGIYDQAIWVWSRFQMPFSTIKNSHIFGDHLIPALAFLSPIYWIIDDVRILLVFQAVWVATGGIPVYLLAKEKLGNVFLSLVLTFSYLSFFGVQNGVVFDFHPLVISVPLIAWWFYLFEKNNRLFLLISLLLLGIQENLSLLVLALGIMAILKRETRQEGLVIAACGFIWFLVATKIIIPYFAGNQTFSYFPQRVPLNPLLFFEQFFFPLIKTKTILLSLGAFGFLPIFYPPILIPLVEQFSERFMGNIVATRWGIGLHYSALLAPILVYGTIKALERKIFQNKKKIFWGVGVLLLGIAVCYQFFFHLPLNLLAKKEFYRLPEGRAAIQKAITLIGGKASVAAQNNLIPHLSHREKIFVFSSCENVPDPSRGMYCRPLVDKPSAGLPLIEKEKVEFILVNFQPGQNPNNFFPDGEERLKKYVEKLLLDKKYKIRFEERETVLLEQI